MYRPVLTRICENYPQSGFLHSNKIQSITHSEVSTNSFW